MPAVLEPQVQSAQDVTSAPPQPPAAVDNLDVLALAAMFKGHSPKSEQGNAPSTASPHADTAASHPEAEPAESEPAAEAPDPETPPSQPPDQPEAEDGSPQPETEPTPDEAEGDAPQDPKAVREFEYPKFQSRVDQLTAKVRDLEAKLAAAGAVKAPEAPAQPTGGEPAQVQLPQPLPVSDAGLQDLDAKIEKANQMIALAAENPDGFSHTGKDGQAVEFSGEQLRRMAARATADLASLSAQREVRLAQLQGAKAQRMAAEYERAAQRYPWLKDPASEKYQAAMALVKEVPALLSRDDVAMIVAGAIEARHGAKANGKPAAKLGTAAKPTVMTTRPAGTATRTPGGALDRQIEEAEKVAERTGSTQDLARVLALRAQRRAIAARAG